MRRYKFYCGFLSSLRDDPFTYGVIPAGYVFVFLAAVYSLFVWVHSPHYQPLSLTALPSQDALEILTVFKESSWEEYLQDLKRRNIFSPIRAEGCPPIVGNPVGKTFRIAGIMIGPRSSVVLESLEGGVFLVLDEGERKDGVLLKKIGSAVVELEDNGRPVILKRSGGAS